MRLADTARRGRYVAGRSHAPLAAANGHHAPLWIWQTYRSLLEFARQVRADTQDLAPRDMIDIQSSMWVQGSY